MYVLHVEKSTISLFVKFSQLVAPKRELQQRCFEVTAAKKPRLDQAIGVDAVRDIETQLRQASQVPLSQALGNLATLQKPSIALVAKKHLLLSVQLLGIFIDNDRLERLIEM